MSRAEIATLLANHPDAPVVIDEAYVDFGAETAIPLVASHPNLLVVQTMSKSRALAGLRVGYAIGDAALVRGADPGQGQLQLLSAWPARPGRRDRRSRGRGLFQQARACVITGRERLSRELVRLGFEVLPSTRQFRLSRATRPRAVRHWRPRFASARSSSAISRPLASPTICGSPWALPDQIDRLLSALSSILELQTAGFLTALFAGRPPDTANPFSNSSKNAIMRRHFNDG